MRRVLVWIAGIVLGLVALIAIALFVVLSSPAIARKVIAMGLRHAPAGLTIGAVHGRLRGPLLLTDIHYRTPAMRVAVDSVAIDWRLSHLLERQLQLDRLHVTGVHVVLADSAPPDTTPKPVSKSRPHLPVSVHLGDVLVRGVTVSTPDSMALQLDSLRLAGLATAYRFHASGDAIAPKVHRVAVHLQGRGSLEDVSLDNANAHLLDGVIAVTGTVGWYPAINWDVVTQFQHLHPNLMMPDTTAWPAVISTRITTRGTIDSLGPRGRADVDSLRGKLRGDSLHGRMSATFADGGYDIETLALAWGVIEARARGSIDSTLNVAYQLTAPSLTPISPKLRGSLTVAGTARGPRTMPHVQLMARGRQIRSGTTRVALLTLKADANVAPHGRIDIALRADSAVVAQRVVRLVTLDAHGTRENQAIDLAAHSMSGNLLLGVRGGIHGRTWSGAVDTLRVDSTVAGSWRLQHRAALDVSSALVRLDTLCVASLDSPTPTDSTHASLCVAGARRPATWHAAINATEVPLTWLARAPASVDDTLSGTLSAHADVSARGSQISGTAHVTAENAALTYRAPGSKTPKRLTLDSAVIDAHIGSEGAHMTAGILVTDRSSHPLATLAATVSLPKATTVAAFSHSRLDAKVDAHAGDLAFLTPFVSGIDSLGGALDVHATASGTVTAPSIDGALHLQHVDAELPGLRSVHGSLDLTAKATRSSRGALTGTVTLVPHQMRYADRQLGRERWIDVSGAGFSFTSGAGGGAAKLDLRLSSDSATAVATVQGTAALPDYGGALPLARQRATVTFAADVSNLHALQLFTTSVDSLRGQFHFKADLHGRIGTPAVTAHLALDSLHALLPVGSTVNGGIISDLQVAVAADSAITGHFRLAPVGMTFSYRENDSIQRVSLDSSNLTASAGNNGVHGSMLLAFSSDSAHLGQIRGDMALPDLRRIGGPATKQAITATVTGRVPDLAFIRAFTPMVDSAAGALSLDSKVTGTIADSHMMGSLEVHHGAFHLPALGILVDSVDLAAHGDEAGGVSIQASMRSGRGTLTVAGTSPINPDPTHPGTVHIAGHDFEAAHRAQLRAVVSPDLTVAITDQLRVTGSVQVPLAYLQLVNIPASAVAPSDDIVLIDTTGAQARSLPINTDVRIVFGDSVTFSGFNFNTRLSGGLHVIQQAEHLATASGTIVIDSGTYKAYGQDLTIQNGKVQFAGGAINNPGLDIRASRTAEDSVVAGLDIQGTLKQPQVTIFSTPAMSQTQALSYIVTGHGVGQGTGSSGNLVSKALSALGLRGGNAVAGTLGHELHLDEAKIETEGDIKQASFVAGTYLSPNVFVSYGIGLFDPVSTLKLRYVVSGHFTLQAQTGQSTGADILFKTTSHAP